MQIEVSDTGIGIPKDKLKTIFDQYEQVRTKIKKKYKGTGLGLAITKKLVEMMHGSIVIKSKINEGTRFIIHLPFEKATIQKTLDNKMTKKNAAFLSGKTILIADDHDDNRFILRESLQFFNKEVIIFEAADGLQAVECAKKK